MKCEYCDFSNFKGKFFELLSMNSGNEDCEIYIMKSSEYRQFVIEIEGIYSDTNIAINYCPICGRELCKIERESEC